MVPDGSLTSCYTPSTSFLGWICTAQIVHKKSSRQMGDLLVDDLDQLSVRCELQELLARRMSCDRRGKYILVRAGDNARPV